MTGVVTNVATSLPLQITTGDTGLFPQALVYDDAGSLDATVNLAHVASGLYRGAHTFTSDGEYDVVFVVYTDAGHTIESTDHGRTTERFTAASSLADQVWDEDVVAGHGTADTSGLLLRALGAGISQRANNPTLDSVLGVPDVAGETIVRQVETIEVVQAWSRSLTPSTLHGIVHLHRNGERVTLPGGAQLAINAYDQGGSLLFNQSGVTPTIQGSDVWFGVDQAYTPTAGTAILAVVTITASGVATGTHVGITEIAFPEF